MGFTKLFSSITESSVWCESDRTLRIWVAMLARKNAHGIVEGSIPGMANLCRMSVDDFKAAINPLLKPDPYSRNPEKDGRRLEVVPGGWSVINHLSYRDRPQDQEGSRAEYYRKYRLEKDQEKKSVSRNNMQQSDVSHNTDTDTDTDTEEIKEKESKKEKEKPLLSDDQKTRLTRQIQIITGLFPGFNPHAFISKNIQSHPEAIIKTISRMIEEKDSIKSPWPWAEAVLTEESKRFSFNDTMKEHEERKRNAPYSISECLKGALK